MASRPIRDEREVQPQDQQGNPNPNQIPLTPEQQEEIIEIVIQDYQSGIEARESKSWGGTTGDELTWDEKYGALMRLYEDQKTARPEKWMANRSLRIAMAIVEMMFAKLFPAVWNEALIRWRPVEFTDQERVDRISKMMKWVVGVQMRLSNIIKPALKYCIKFGNSILKDRWVVEYKDKGEVESKTIVDEMGRPVLDGMGQSQTIEERVLSVDQRCEVELVKLEKLIIQPGQTDIQKEPIIHILDYYYSDLELAEAQALMINVSNLVKDKVDNRILSEMEESLEEAEKLSKTNIKRRSYPLEVLEWYGPYDANGDGFPEECIFLVDRTTRTYLGGEFLYNRSKRVKRPFTKLGFIEREHAFYWIGVLEQIKPLAEELDAAMNQLIDANTLSIMRWGFYDPTGDYEPETHVAKPRAMYPVRNPSQNVYFPDIQIPIERLINAMRLVLEFVERLTAASDYIMGRESSIVGGSGTATRTQAIVGAANERYAIPVDNLRSGVSELLTNILCQYQKNIPKGLESRILGEKGEMIFRPGELYDQSISGELDAYLAATASMGDRNLEAEISNWVYQNLMMNPLVASSMERVYKVTEKAMKGVLGMDQGEIEQIIGERPYTKPSSNPEDEHTMIRQGQEVHPLPQEQHLYHLMQHTQKLQDPEMVLWEKEAVALLQAHISETQQMMAQVMQLAMKASMGGKNAGGKQGGSSPAVKGVESAPGKGISESGSPEPYANQEQGVESPTTIGG